MALRSKVLCRAGTRGLKSIPRCNHKVARETGGKELLSFDSKDWQLLIAQQKQISNPVPGTSGHKRSRHSETSDPKKNDNRRSLRATVQGQYASTKAPVGEFTLQLLAGPGELFDELGVKLSSDGKTLSVFPHGVGEPVDKSRRVVEYFSSLAGREEEGKARTCVPAPLSPVFRSGLMNEITKGNINLGAARTDEGEEKPAVLSAGDPKSSLVVKGTCSLIRKKKQDLRGCGSSSLATLGEVNSSTVEASASPKQRAVRVCRLLKENFLLGILGASGDDPEKVRALARKTSLYVSGEGTLQLLPSAAVSEIKSTSYQTISGGSHGLLRSSVYRFLAGLFSPRADSSADFHRVNLIRMRRKEPSSQTGNITGPETSPVKLASLEEPVRSMPVTNRPETSIKIVHTDYTQHRGHPINRMIGWMNRFGELTFRNKETSYDVGRCMRLAKAIGVPQQMLKGAINAQSMKNRDFVVEVKERMLRQLWALINTENGVMVKQEDGKMRQYKFCVCRGNNPMLVKAVLKQRWWWSYGGKDDENLNLLWTQWCKKAFVQTLACARSATVPAAASSSSSNSLLIVPEDSRHQQDTKTNAAETPLRSAVCESVSPTAVRMCNHLERHYHLSNKKAMFINLSRYYLAMKEDPLNTLPLTFHIQHGTEDPEFVRFAEHFRTLEAQSPPRKAKHRRTGSERPRRCRNVWIVKPGEYSNRGHGIQVLNNFEEIRRIVSSVSGKGPAHTFIVQKYIENPLLVSRRKFDIRMFGMITSINGLMKGYFYEEGYIRTSSKEFSLKNLSNKAVHLTNDAVQQKEEDYGKFESGNKLSFSEFQKYLDGTSPGLNVDFCRDILPQIKVNCRASHRVENSHGHVPGGLSRDRPQSAAPHVRGKVSTFDFPPDVDLRLRFHARHRLQGLSNRGQHEPMSGGLVATSRSNYNDHGGFGFQVSIPSREPEVDWRWTHCSPHQIPGAGSYRPATFSPR